MIRSARGLGNLLDVYWTEFKVEVASSMQYRFQMAFQMLGFLVEPVIYLVVWTTVARERGGEVGGYTVSEFAAYFIAWTVVRQITIGWSPFWMERRIRRGELSPLLLRPVHPFHTDTANQIAFKAVTTLTLLPTIGVLILLFRPELNLVAWSLLALGPALVMAFVLRYVLMYAMSLSAFWTTRVTAAFEVFFAIEFFLSGRIAPLALLPEWARHLAGYFPFQWMFYFPLELMLGRLTPAQAGAGFLLQTFWAAVSVALVIVIWRAGVRRYAAVGG